MLDPNLFPEGPFSSSPLFFVHFRALFALLSPARASVGWLRRREAVFLMAFPDRVEWEIKNMENLGDRRFPA